MYPTPKCSVEPGWHGSLPSSRGEGSVYLVMSPGFRALHQQIRYCCQATVKTVIDHVQTGNTLAEDPTPPGFTRSVRTPAWLHLKLWSWRKIDDSGGQSQRRKATAERYTRSTTTKQIKTSQMWRLRFSTLSTFLNLAATITVYD